MATRSGRAAWLLACVLVLFGIVFLRAAQAAELDVRGHPSGGEEESAGGDGTHGGGVDHEGDEKGGDEDAPPASPAAGYFYDAGNPPPWVSPPYAALAPPRGPVFAIPNHATIGLLAKQVDFERPIPPEPLFPLDDGNAAPRLPASSLMYPYPLSWLEQQQNVGVNPPPVFIQKAEQHHHRSGRGSSTTTTASLKSRIRMVRSQNRAKRKS